jgi:hypothetical protein
MAVDPFSILSLAGSAVGGLVDMLTPKPVANFTSQAEYDAAREKYKNAIASKNPLDWRAITELEPAITAWDQMTARKKFRQEGVDESLRRLDESQGLQTKQFLSNQYGKQGIRGQGAIHDPLEALARQIRYQKADVNRSLAGEQMTEEQNMQNQATAQRYGLQEDSNKLIGQFGSLALGIGGQFGKGGVFGGPTDVESAILNQNKLYKNMYQYEPGFIGPQNKISFY